MVSILFPNGIPEGFETVSGLSAPLPAALEHRRGMETCVCFCVAQIPSHRDQPGHTTGDTAGDRGTAHPQRLASQKFEVRVKFVWKLFHRSLGTGEESPKQRDAAAADWG